MYNYNNKVVPKISNMWWKQVCTSVPLFGDVVFIRQACRTSWRNSYGFWIVFLKGPHTP